MSLNDLKKQKPSVKKEKVSIDQFIEQANDYAKGKLTSKNSHSVRKRNFRNATFSLSPKQIEQLATLSQNSGICKSRIIRLLINMLAEGNDLTLEKLLDHLEHTE